MALLNRPLTETEAREIVVNWRKQWSSLDAWFSNVMREAFEGPIPHTVSYDGNKARYSAPDDLSFTLMKRGPSNCIWIVPGTLEKRL